MDENFYASVIKATTNGFAYHHIIKDENGIPINYEYLDVNTAFERLTGLQNSEIIGKKVTEIIPGIEKDVFDWIKYFGDIAINQTEKTFIQYSDVLKKWYSVFAFSPEKDYFAVIFSDVTDVKNAEENISQFFSISLELLCIADMDGYFKHLSNSWEKVIGWTNQELMSKQYLDFVHPDDVQRTIDAMNDLKNGKNVNNFKNRYLCKDGSYKWLLWNTSNIKEKNLIYAVARDITNEKRAEDNLKKIEDTIESIREGISYKFGDEFFQSIVISLSKALRAECTVIAEVLENEKDYIHSISTSCNKILIDNFKCSIKDTPCENVITKNEGCIYLSNAFKLFPNDILLTELEIEGYIGIPLHNSKKEVIGIMFALYTDKISNPEMAKKVLEIFSYQVSVEIERRKVENDLKQSEEKYRALVENLPDVVARYDKDCKFLYVNSAVIDFVGRSPDEFIGKTHYEAGIEYNIAIFRDNTIKDVFEKKKISEKIYKMETYGGEKVFHWIVVPEFDEWGNVNTVLSISRDITKQKEYEQKLLEAKEKAETATNAKTRFLATMSHEIRTPMNSVIGMTSLLMQTHLSTEQKKFTEIIKSSGEVLIKIIDDILDFSKIESGKMEIENKVFEIKSCIRDTINFVSPKAMEKNIDLIYFIDPDVPFFIIGDKRRLIQILLNIIDNAVKFTEYGKIYISVGVVKKDSKSLEIIFSVTDTGIGISDSKKDIIFEIFSQGDSSMTRRFGGSGLGLAISKKLVEMMGGKIWVESQLQKGSTFFFTIETRESERFERFEKNTEKLPFVDKTALIISSNEMDLNIISLICKNWGMKISSFLELENFNNIKNEKFDVIIIDSDNIDLNEFDKNYENFMTKSSIIALSSNKNFKSDINSSYSYLLKPIKQSSLFEILFEIIKQTPDSKINLPQNNFIAKDIPLKILIAEDNELNQELMFYILSKFGYTPKAVSNGLETLSELEKNSYDIIFMDIEMPELDGIETTKKIIKKYPDKSQRPKIIALTAGAMMEDKKRCFENGMDDYLSKPITLEDIQNILKKWGKKNSFNNANSKF